MNERVQSASRYVAGDARYGGRTGPPPPPGAGVAVDAPPVDSATQRPRARGRRVPTNTSARYQAPRGYNDEMAPPPSEFDEVDDEFQLDDELKMEFDRSVMAHRRPQRMKYVKCKTRVQPDLLVPYLYGGDRRSRIHQIIERTGCTIDYCPESPGDEDIVMDRSDFMMNFLVTAETAGQLEAATRLLRVLVDRVQVHVENKLNSAAARRASLDRRNNSHEGSPQQTHVRRFDPRHPSDGFSPRYPSMLKTEPQDEMGGSANQADARLPGGQDMGATEMPATTAAASMPRHRHSERWIDDESAAWSAHAVPEEDPHHYRPSRHYGTPRFHRPVYRRILVDENGYEVMYPPQFDHLRRLSPRLSAASAAMSSPPMRRRRQRDAGPPQYHETSSSEGEVVVQGRRDTSMRSSTRAVPGSARPGGAGFNNASFNRADGVEFSVRRGVKRRLDPRRGENMHPHYRMSRRCPAVHEFLSDGDEDGMFLSGDEYIDDMYDETTLPWYANEREQSTFSPPVDTGEELRSEVGKRGADEDNVVNESAVNLPAAPDVVTATALEGVVDLNGSCNQAKSAPELESLVLLKSPVVSSSASSGVETNVSIVFGRATHSGDDAVGDQSSDAEPEKATRTAVMPHCDPGHPTSMSPSQRDEVKVPSAENIRGIERVDNVETVSTTAVEATSHSPGVEERSEPDLVSSENLKAVARFDEEDSIADLKGDEEAELMSSTKPATAMMPQGRDRLPARVRLNDAMKEIMDRSSRNEIVRTRVESTLLAMAKRASSLAAQAASHEELRQLAQVAQEVECEVWRQRSVHSDTKQALSATLGSAIQFASDQTIPPRERMMALQRGLTEVISREVERLLKEAALQPTVPVVLPVSSPTHLLAAAHVEPVAEQVEPIVRERKRTVESPPPSAPTVPSALLIEVREAQKKPERLPPPSTYMTRVPKYDLKRDSTTAPLSIPREAPSFVSELVLELERSTGLSSVMASAQKRLLREISKSDPYYYLHTMPLSDGPRKGRAGSSCPFGCSGVSAQKWERKVVSQISSRMKWFDSVAYSLAKVSGGKELLSRKKLNSTVRKLHLVALQLHCLIGHLYCLRKRAVCREIDSLPTALNNSYYEKRMNGYKSRLKLTVYKPPSPLHAAGTGGTPAPPEELLRDTFEFYPELLLCVDIWGYDDRQGTPESKAKVPSELFRKVSQLAFDFENDTNGLLQSICEELLSILCQWNDFKWGESLESLTIDDIVAFEAKVKTSIRKILDAHATHLLAQWSGLLLHKPLALKHVRLTQANVYYSEQPVSTSTQVPIATSSTATSSKSFLLFRRDDEDDDDEDMNEEEEEDSMVHNFWRSRFAPTSTSTSASSTSSSSSESVKAKAVLPPLNLSKLGEEDLLKSTKEAGPLCDEYDMRQRCLALSGTTGRLEVGGDADVGDLLRQLTQARSVVEEAIRTSEQLTLHSFSQQRKNNRKIGEGGQPSSGGLGSFGYDECMSDASQDDDDAIVDALLSSLKSPQKPKPSVQVESAAEPEARNLPTSEAANEDTSAWAQPMMKDLLEIVASTNHEISDICGQRARSARVRDKLQSQSLDLARQSIQIFQTILNMKP